MPILWVIAGPDWRDPAVVAMPIEDPATVEPGTLRIAYYTDNGITPPSAETADAVMAAVKVLSDRGATVVEDRPPDVDRSKTLWVELVTADGGAAVRKLLAAVGTEQMHPLIEWTQQREALSSVQLVEALARWVELRSRNLRFLKSYDLIVCPVNASPATLHDAPSPSDYTYHYNLLGWPVAVVRCGSSPEGLPIGVQVVARPWREDVAVAAAGWIETDRGGWVEPAIQPDTARSGEFTRDP